MQKDLFVTNLLQLDKTIARDLFESVVYPWQILIDIKDYIVALGKKLSSDEYDNPSENVWISKTAKVMQSAYIAGPCIIDHGAEIRQCAFIRSSAIIGKNAVVGNSTELKNVVLFDKVQLPHFNYAGDSIFGYASHIGAGGATSNLKLDKTPVKIRYNDEEIETGLKKFGAILGDGAQVGCNSVLNPGCIIMRGTIVYPTSCVRGIVEEGCIYKDKDHIMKKDIR